MTRLSKKDRLAMKEAARQIIEEENKQHKKDSDFLEIIKKQVSPEFFELIDQEITDSEHASNFRITNAPEGESTGTTDIKVWVDQHSVGDSGDSWAGTQCVELPDKTYLTWDYWM